MPPELVLVDRRGLLPPEARRRLEAAVGEVDAAEVEIVATVLPSRADAGGLTPRERDVLRLLALGHTNREVAGALFISVRTAELHRRNAQRKLRISGRAELVRRAHELGLVD